MTTKTTDSPTGDSGAPEGWLDPARRSGLLFAQFQSGDASALSARSVFNSPGNGSSTMTVCRSLLRRCS
jgi:hypothetical protein